jgi:hypothetical protein
MARKKIFTIGFDLPGEEFEYIPFDSDQSLLDADIVLFAPGFGHHYPSETYQGEPLFSPSSSVSVAQNIQHWRNEIAAATNVGKLVVIYLSKPLSYYRYTGDKQYSGTGRSRVTTNIVTHVTSYSAVPNITTVEAKTGREVRLTKEGSYLASYWKEFAENSPYQAFIDGKFSHNVLTTKTGSKTVAASVHGKGSLLFLPPISYDEKKFVKYNSKTDQALWTPEAMKFGKKLSAALISLFDTLATGRSTTPPPAWVLDPMFRTEEEVELQDKIAQVSKSIGKLQQRKTGLEQRLDEVGSFRSLLFEQGKPLERAVREALVVLGFSAEPFADSDSEFDVVFESEEGRCLGEVEGRDNKAVSIEKFSQLERNLQEDFSREGVSEYAKGVLFGNAERLTPPQDRNDSFTTKCLTAAARVGAALVKTSDLYQPIRYLLSHSDPEYAKACREAIFCTKGSVVGFPSPPEVGLSEMVEEVSTSEPTVDVNADKGGGNGVRT